MYKSGPIVAAAPKRETIAGFIAQIVNSLSQQNQFCHVYPLPHVCIVTDGVRNDIDRRIVFGYDRYQKRFYETSNQVLYFPTTSAFESRMYQLIQNHMQSATLFANDFQVHYTRGQLVE